MLAGMTQLRHGGGAEDCRDIRLRGSPLIGLVEIDVVIGDIINNVPGLLDHYEKNGVPFGDVISNKEKAALDGHAGKLVIESPESFAKTVLFESTVGMRGEGR